MKYIANPVVVDALKIVAVSDVQTDGSRNLDLEDGSTFHATNEMLCRIPHLQDGAYVVIQADGYVYLNPAAVFERKYSLYVDPKAPEPKEPETKQQGIIERIKTAGLDGLTSIIRANAEDGETPERID